MKMRDITEGDLEKQVDKHSQDANIKAQTKGHTMGMTDDEQKVLHLLSNYPAGLSLSKVGVKLGKPFPNAASWASPIVKSLLMKNLISKKLAAGSIVYTPLL